MFACHTAFLIRLGGKNRDDLRAIAISAMNGGMLWRLMNGTSGSASVLQRAVDAVTGLTFSSHREMLWQRRRTGEIGERHHRSGRKPKLLAEHQVQMMMA